MIQYPAHNRVSAPPGDVLLGGPTEGMAASVTASCMVDSWPSQLIPVHWVPSWALGAWRRSSLPLRLPLVLFFLTPPSNYVLSHLSNGPAPPETDPVMPPPPFTAPSHVPAPSHMSPARSTHPCLSWCVPPALYVLPTRADLPPHLFVLPPSTCRCCRRLLPPPTFLPPPTRPRPDQRIPA